MAVSGRFRRAAGHGAESAGSLRARELTIGDYANGFPRIRLGDVVSGFFAQLLWVIPLFLIGVVAVWFLTKDIKRVYTGEGRILVQIGSEYVYDPASGEQAPGLNISPDHIVLNEIGLMKNTDVINSVIEDMVTEFGEKRFAQSAYEKITAARLSGNKTLQAHADFNLHKTVDESFHIAAQPKSSLVDLAYEHEDPEIAVAALNAFIEAYLENRRRVFVEGVGGVISERRASTESELAKADQAIQDFLKKHGVSDFESEQTGVEKRMEDLRAALNKLRADMAETESALASVETQLRSTPETIDLSVDDRASQRIAQAELELSQLLVKYLPSSLPVQRKQEEIRQLRAVQSSNGGRAVGGRRVGPNTVYQSLLTRRNELQSRADSFREKEFTVQKQLNAADQKVRRFNRLLPDYNILVRQRDSLGTSLQQYNSREQEALLNRQQAAADSENVRVITYASIPQKGRNMRALIFLGGVVGWGFTLVMFALMRVFLSPALYAPAAGMGATYIPQTASDRAQAYRPQTYHTEAAGVAATAQQGGVAEPQFHHMPGHDYTPAPSTTSYGNVAVTLPANEMENGTQPAAQTYSSQMQNNQAYTDQGYAQTYMRPPSSENS